MIKTPTTSKVKAGTKRKTWGMGGGVQQTQPGSKTRPLSKSKEKDRDGDVKMTQEKPSGEYDGTEELVQALRCSKEIREAHTMYDFITPYLDSSIDHDQKFCTFLKNTILCTMDSPNW